MKKFCSVVIMIASASWSRADTTVYMNANAGVSTVSNYNAAYNANVGYMSTDYLGLEAGYTWNTGNNYWDVAAKALLPVPIVDIYGKLGWAFVDGENYNSSGGVLYGVGISMPLFPMFKLNIEDYAVSNYTTQNFVMAGLQFSF